MARNPREKPFNGADERKFDPDEDGNAGGGRASGARIPFVDVEHGSVVVLTPEDGARRGAAVRPASHQDLMIAGRSDLIGPK